MLIIVGNVEYEIIIGEKPSPEAGAMSDVGDLWLQSAVDSDRDLRLYYE